MWHGCGYAGDMVNEFSRERKMDCLAFVKTPLQLINATEYMFANNIGGAILFVVCDSRKYTVEFYKKLIPSEIWKRTVFFIYSKNIFARSKIKGLGIIGEIIDDFRFKKFLNREIQSLDECRDLLIGNPRDLWCRYVSKKISSINLVDSEDGSASLCSSFEPSKGWILRNMIMRFSKEDPKIDQLFSAFKSENQEILKVQRNEYSHTRGLIQFGKVRSENEVWFVGQPLVELDIMTADNYVQVLRNVLMAYEKNNTVKYFPHPAEEKRNIQRICRNLGMDQIVKELPLEFVLLNGETVPSKLAFLYSSAISTVNKIFGDNIEIHVHKPCFGMFEKKMTEDMYREVYDGIENEIKYPNKVILIDGRCS